MPKVNLETGAYGIFIPAYDKAAFWFPHPFDNFYAVDDNSTAGVVMNLAPIADAFWQINLSKFLQQISFSPNVTMGGVYGANRLAAIDLVYSVAGQPLTFVVAGLEQDRYVDGQPPIVFYTGSTVPPSPIPPPPQFFLQGTPPLTVNFPSYHVARLTLPDYWLIDQNQPDTCTSALFSFGVPGTIRIAGLQIYFGNV